MSEHFDENVPPDLADVAGRLSSARPEPSDGALNNAMTRAQRVRPSRKSSLLWRSTPRMGGRTRGVAVASVLAVVGMTGAAAVVNSTVSDGGLPVVSGEAAAVQYAACPDGLAAAVASAAAGQAALDALLILGPAVPNEQILAAQVNVANLNAQVLVCQGLIP